MIKYNSLDKVFLVDIRDLISSKVNHLEGEFVIFLEPFQVVGLYNTKGFEVKCFYKIIKVGNSFVLNIKVDSFIPVNCDYCGNDFDYHFSFKVEEFFVPFYEYKGNFEDLSYFIFKGDEMDVGRVCMENFISNLPSIFSDGCKL
jgi:uncharacterized metal-binding protein YceD (DUF177 family)